MVPDRSTPRHIDIRKPAPRRSPVAGGGALNIQATGPALVAWTPCT